MNPKIVSREDILNNNEPKAGDRVELKNGDEAIVIRPINGDFLVGLAEPSVNITDYYSGWEG